jgi:hypothetical protein
MNTYIDLFIQGLPFVILTPDMGDLMYYPISQDSAVVYVDRPTGSYWFTSKWNQNRLSISLDSVSGLDYFEGIPEISSPIGIKTCTCDFYSVILITGCICGGK